MRVREDRRCRICTFHFCVVGGLCGGFIRVCYVQIIAATSTSYGRKLIALLTRTALETLLDCFVLVEMRSCTFRVRRSFRLKQKLSEK